MTLFACRPEGAELSPLVLRASEKKNGRSQKNSLLFPWSGEWSVGRTVANRQGSQNEGNRLASCQALLAHLFSLSLSFFLSLFLLFQLARSLRSVQFRPSWKVLLLLLRRRSSVWCVWSERARESKTDSAEREGKEEWEAAPNWREKDGGGGRRTTRKRYEIERRI